MDVTLSPDLQKFVDQQVDSGKYKSASDVISNAISFWRENEALHRQEEESLRSEITVGIAQLDRGEGEPWDAERLKQRVIRQMAERRNG